VYGYAWTTKAKYRIDDVPDFKHKFLLASMFKTTRPHPTPTTETDFPLLYVRTESQRLFLALISHSRMNGGGS
jgi:hypothetical protein